MFWWGPFGFSNRIEDQRAGGDRRSLPQRQPQDDGTGQKVGVTSIGEVGERRNVPGLVGAHLQETGELSSKGHLVRGQGMGDGGWGDFGPHASHICILLSIEANSIDGLRSPERDRSRSFAGGRTSRG